jgi:hypothetical protein
MQALLSLGMVFVAATASAEPVATSGHEIALKRASQTVAESLPAHMEVKSKRIKEGLLKPYQGIALTGGGAYTVEVTAGPKAGATSWQRMRARFSKHRTQDVDVSVCENGTACAIGDARSATPRARAVGKIRQTLPVGRLTKAGLEFLAKDPVALGGVVATGLGALGVGTATAQPWLIAGGGAAVVLKASAMIKDQKKLNFDAHESVYKQVHQWMKSEWQAGRAPTPGTIYDQYLALHKQTRNAQSLGATFHPDTGGEFLQRLRGLVTGANTPPPVAPAK